MQTKLILVYDKITIQIKVFLKFLRFSVAAKKADIISGYFDEDFRSDLLVRSLNHVFRNKKTFERN